MFIKVTSVEAERIVRVNIHSISNYYFYRCGARINFTNEFGIDAIETPEQIDELIKQAMEKQND